MIKPEDNVLDMIFKFNKEWLKRQPNMNNLLVKIVFIDWNTNKLAFVKYPDGIEKYYDSISGFNTMFVPCMPNSLRPKYIYKRKPRNHE
jgi:hypothetical protein